MWLLGTVFVNFFGIAFLFTLVTFAPEFGQSIISSIVKERLDQAESYLFIGVFSIISACICAPIFAYAQFSKRLRVTSENQIRRDDASRIKSPGSQPERDNSMGTSTGVAATSSMASVGLRQPASTPMVSPNLLPPHNLHKPDEKILLSMPPDVLFGFKKDLIELEQLNEEEIFDGYRDRRPKETFLMCLSIFANKSNRMSASKWLVSRALKEISAASMHKYLVSLIELYGFPQDGSASDPDGGAPR